MKTNNVTGSSDGVSLAMVEEWEATIWRLKGELRFFKFPRGEDVIAFFQGDESYRRGGKGNIMNNPLRLIRPITLYNVCNIRYYNGIPYGYPNYHRKSQEDGKNSDGQKESDYIQVIKAFEMIALTALKSLNEPSAEIRRQIVKKAIDGLFQEDASKRSLEFAGINIKKISRAENPAGWLVYIVLSLLNHPDERITPLGRLRALELLRAYPFEDLLKDFGGRPSTGEYLYSNGYNNYHIVRLPYTFCNRYELLMKHHDEMWRCNNYLKGLIAERGASVDWRTTINAIISRRPREAIQIALIMLHSGIYMEGALALLWVIPELDPLSLEKIIGSQATFLAEHKIAANASTLSQVMEGAGLIEPTAVDDQQELEEMSREELLQIIRRERIR